MSDSALAPLEDQVNVRTREVSIRTEDNKLDNSLFSKELAPHYMQLAGKLASSAMVPKAYQNKPQDLFICWAMGYQIGMSPEQSMQCIAVINGRPCLWGDDMLALCMVHKDFVDIIETPIMSNTNTVMGYRCTVKRRNMADHSEIFDLNMAKKAGLLGKAGPWTQYPERMMKLRARGFALRDKFPDALKGIKSREEVEDYVDAEYHVVENKPGSRTEQLKHDFLTKTGKLNAEENTKNVPSDGDKLINETAQENEQSEKEIEDGKKTVELHTEIRRLLVEKSFTDERLIKALEYYEADRIDELDEKSALHFIGILAKA